MTLWLATWIYLNDVGCRFDPGIFEFQFVCFYGVKEVIVSVVLFVSVSAKLSEELGSQRLLVNNEPVVRGGKGLNQTHALKRLKL